VLVEMARGEVSAAELHDWPAAPRHSTASTCMGGGVGQSVGAFSWVAPRIRLNWYYMSTQLLIEYRLGERRGSRVPIEGGSKRMTCPNSSPMQPDARRPPHA
jgi:hypothetical protein